MSKWLHRAAILLFVLMGILSVGGDVYLQQPKFGALPAGRHLQVVENSAHYENGGVPQPCRHADAYAGQ